ncbi:tyrosine-type recombinase/integrase [Peptostreptococcus faecalis]|uniref:tyrosine-type recombinase/integrase n=1 Tax=Peptostreptococcus faecalis TaxID=2045015 RepID=UPI000C7CB524|nr:tyrosine-type recombinase/integrase [Peptostreptococcus faecalis]
MRAVIRKNKGKLETAISYRDKLTDKIKYKRIKVFETREAAEINREEIQRKINTGEIKTIGEINHKKRFGECIEEAFKKERERGEYKSGNTYNAYMGAYNSHINDEKNGISDYIVSRMTTKDLQDFIDKKAETLSKSTVNIIVAVIRKGVHYALQNNFIDRDITVGLKIWGRNPKKAKDNVLDYDVLNEILKKTKGTDIGLQMLLGASLGLRESEILGLSWDNIDLDENIITINQIIVRDENKKPTLQPYTKNKEPLYLAIPDALKENLMEYKLIWDKKMSTPGAKNIENLLFLNRKFELTNPSSLSIKFKKIMNENGIEGVTFHGLRHSYATMLNEDGLSIKEISKLLNHKNIRTTKDIYVHLFKDVNKASVSAVNKKINM